MALKTHFNVFFNTQWIDYEMKDRSLPLALKIAKVADSLLFSVRYFFGGYNVGRKDQLFFRVSSFHHLGSQHKSRSYVNRDTVYVSGSYHKLKGAMAILLFPVVVLGTLIKLLTYFSLAQREAHRFFHGHLIPKDLTFGREDFELYGDESLAWDVSREYYERLNDRIQTIVIFARKGIEFSNVSKPGGNFLDYNPKRVILQNGTIVEDSALDKSLKDWSRQTVNSIEEARMTKAAKRTIFFVEPKG